MIYVFLGQSKKSNRALVEFLDHYQENYQVYHYQDIDREILQFLLSKTDDCFEILNPSLQHYKDSYDVSFSDLCNIVLSNPIGHLRFPIVVKNDRVLPNVVTKVQRSILRPKIAKKTLAFQYRCHSSLMEFEGRRFSA